MSNLFSNKGNFNENIGLWNTSNVTDMGNMFYNAGSFNQDINTKPNQVDSNDNTYTAWDTSKVKNMSSMFYDTEFNISINGWDVGNVTNMSLCFIFLVLELQ